MPRRLEDWPERLAQFLCAAAGQRFKWGQRDCALFACDAVREITGEDLASDFRGPDASGRGNYRDAAGARRAMRKFLKTARSPKSQPAGSRLPNPEAGASGLGPTTDHRPPTTGLLERVCEAIARARALEEIAPRQAQRGDLVLLTVAGDQWPTVSNHEPPTTDPRPLTALGIVALDGRILAAGSDGVVNVAIAAGRRAWRVG